MANRIVRPRPGGVLNPRAASERFDLTLYRPAPELASFVQHYWSVRWDLRGREPYPQHTLSNPSVHLVIQPDHSWISGVVTSRFTYVLRGRSRVFAIRFKPAGFHPFLGSPLSSLTDRRVPISEVFGQDGDALVERVLCLEDESVMVEATDAFVRDRLPPPDPVVADLNAIVEQVIADRGITRVDDLATRVGMGRRTLQRLFSEYVGVSPKWVIQRYRVHDAAARLDDGEAVDLAALALELGYFDQAHFARAFKAIVGKSPTEYARTAGRPN